MATLSYLTTLPLDDDWLDRLAQLCPELRIRREVAAHPDEIADETWRQVEVLHTSTVFPDPMKAPRLRWIQLDTSGVEHVTGEPIWHENVTVTTLGGIAPVPMAEFTIGRLLALAHHQPLLDELRQRHSWPDPAERLATLTPLPVDGATATIVGYGRIGREVARLAQSLGMRVIGLSRRGPVADVRGDRFDTGRGVAETDAVEHLPIDRLRDVLGRTDYLIVVVPLTADTKGLLDADAFAALKPGACVIDVSRGGVVDPASLLAALRSGAVRYAALDVFDDEPLAQDSVWWEEPNTLVSPHVAGLTSRYREQVLELVSSNVSRYLNGQPLLNRADRAAGY